MLPKSLDKEKKKFINIINVIIMKKDLFYVNSVKIVKIKNCIFETFFTKLEIKKLYFHKEWFESPKHPPDQASGLEAKLNSNRLRQTHTHLAMYISFCYLPSLN